MEVLEHEHDRPVAGGRADNQRDRLEKPVARAAGIAAMFRRLTRKLRDEPAELAHRPRGNRRGEPRVPAQRLGERRVRRDGVLEAASRENRRAPVPRFQRERRDQPGLAGAGLAQDRHHRGVARTGLARRPLRRRRSSASSRPTIGATSARHSAAGSGGGGRSPASRGTSLSISCTSVRVSIDGSMPRSRRRPARSARYQGDRARSVARAREAPDERARRLLRQRVEREALAAVVHRKA